MITDYETYEQAKRKFTWSEVWDVFDGNRENFNIAHECIDRHIERGVAVRIKFEDGHSEKYSFEEISRRSSQFANMIGHMGIEFGDRVAIMVEPSLEFYVSLFGTLKRGAIAVPFFPLFGPEAIEYRLKDSGAKMFVTTEEKAKTLGDSIPHVVKTGPSFMRQLERENDEYQPQTSPENVAVFQYTSGATRKFPEAIKHFHKSVATLMPAALFGIGLTTDDHYYCPSSPAWGHGLWYGTMAPLALGVAAGSYSGKFDEKRLLEALEEFEVNNISAAPTVYRRIRNVRELDRFHLRITKISYTGEPMDTETFNFLKESFGVSPCGFYGSTEVGVIILNYGGFRDWITKPGSLGKPMLGLEVAVIDAGGKELPPGEIGEIALKRRDGWFRVKDAGVVDQEGYFWHKGRVDDIIISAGWTISSVEVEDTLLKHPAVQEAAVIGIPDRERGEIVKAFIKAKPKPSLELRKDLQEFVKTRLSRHEYPREVEFVDSIPKTEGGKVNRKALKRRTSGLQKE